MRSLAGYNLFTPGLAARLDPICAGTAERLHAPVSMVSIILDSAQFILGSYGLQGWVAEVQGVPAEWAVCTHTVLAGAPYCVADALADPEHVENPLLAAAGLRSYAGAPLFDDSGGVLGAHLVIDSARRVFTDQELEVLHDAAAKAMQVLAGTMPSARPGPGAEANRLAGPGALPGRVEDEHGADGVVRVDRHPGVAAQRRGEGRIEGVPPAALRADRRAGGPAVQAAPGMVRLDTPAV